MSTTTYPGIPALYDEDGRQIIPIKRRLPRLSPPRPDWTGPASEAPQPERPYYEGFGYILRWALQDEWSLTDDYPDGIWDAYLPGASRDELIMNGASREAAARAVGNAAELLTHWDEYGRPLTYRQES